MNKNIIPDKPFCPFYFSRPANFGFKKYGKIFDFSKKKGGGVIIQIFPSFIFIFIPAPPTGFFNQKIRNPINIKCVA